MAVRIPFRFKEGALEAAYVYAVLDSDSLHTYASIEFLVDTGAVKTIVSDKDANRLAVDYKQLEKLERHSGNRGNSGYLYIKKCKTDF